MNAHSACAGENITQTSTILLPLGPNAALQRTILLRPIFEKFDKDLDVIDVNGADAVLETPGWRSD